MVARLRHLAESAGFRARGHSYNCDFKSVPSLAAPQHSFLTCASSSNYSPFYFVQLPVHTLLYLL